MTTKETLSEQYYIELINHASSHLGLSYSEIRAKYSDYPICLMEYIEKEVHQKAIEIRFDTECVEFTCYFDDENNCDASYLYFDKEEEIEPFIYYLIDNSNYNFILSRWALSDCYMKVSKIEKDVYLIFFRSK